VKDVSISGSDRFTWWFSQRYMLVFILLIFGYVGLPFLAPVLMKTGAVGPAKVIYTIYSPLCHQLAFRSWFLFGDQPVYPLALAGVEGLNSYEDYTGLTGNNLLAARDFLGNEIMGYKTALCERDIAIYGALLLFAVIFTLTGRKIKPLPWYYWIIFGMVPIGLDGLSQLPSLAAGLFRFIPLTRESTPLLRTITGGLFGFCTAWYMFLLIEDSMSETARYITNKMRGGYSNQSLLRKPDD